VTVGVHFGIQPLQSVGYSERGIARYVGELADALWRRHPEVMSDFVFDAEGEFSRRLREYAGDRPLRAAQDLEITPGEIYHLNFAFGDQELDRLWPPRVRNSGCRLVVTLHDVIPLLFPERYLPSARTARRYRAWLRVVQFADRVHTVSKTTADDAIERLSLQPERVEVVGSSPSAVFAPAADLDAAHRELERTFQAVRPGFLLYTGGSDWRKNLDGLLVAYASMSRELRDQHQLVVVYKMDTAEQATLRSRLETLGLTHDVVFTGFVTDAQLALLYQTTTLFVFPSLYEGFGLPVAEALACGAPVICSDRSSLPEVLPEPAAHFDPTDPISIRAAIERALTDPDHLRRLRSQRLAPDLRWEAVADRTARSYGELARRRRASSRRRKRLAIVSPLPPMPSGVADYSARLASHLAEWCEVTVFVDDSSGVECPAGASVERLRDMRSLEVVHGAFDRVLCVVGNQTFHISAIQLLDKRPCSVLVHDVRLDGLWAWSSANRPDFVPQTFHERLQAQYGGRVPPELGSRGWLEREEAEQWGIWMVEPVVSAAQDVYCHSEFAAEVAIGDAGESSRSKVHVLPFAHPPVLGHPDGGVGGAPLVASFGVVSAVKALDLTLEAMCELGVRDPLVRFAIVGPVVDEVRDMCMARARLAGIAERLQITGRVPTAEYWEWLRRTTVAIQLRAATGGESSAAVADCMAAGIPTVVTDLGPQAELDDASVEKVNRGIGPDLLAETLHGLLRDPARRQRVAVSAQAWARDRSFSRVAAEMYRRVVLRVERVVEGTLA
jgi:glycosyltransferase involved in cell wall biosynthesis